MPHGAVDAAATPAPTVATMEQIDNRFVPHVLVVQTDTLVAFPNNDSVSHHVYSFSESKQFELDLYRGNFHTPELFDKPGLVVLGCNIHDNMLGYILVVDTPFFAISGEDGHARFSGLPEGDYEMQVWTPRLPMDQQIDAFDVHIGSGATWQQEIEFSAKLLPAHDTEQGSLSWKDY
jgi:plastocyanin